MLHTLQTLIDHSLINISLMMQQQTCKREQKIIQTLNMNLRVAISNGANSETPVCSHQLVLVDARVINALIHKLILMKRELELCQWLGTRPRTRELMSDFTMLTTEELMLGQNADGIQVPKKPKELHISTCTLWPLKDGITATLLRPLNALNPAISYLLCASNGLI